MPPARGEFFQLTKCDLLRDLEQRVVLDLTNGRAVCTLHIVGKDFQLRLRVDLRVVGKQQIAIGLFGVRFLGLLVDDDSAMKHSPRLPIQNSVVNWRLPACGPTCSISM
jgi:hypothetical protein